MYSTPILSTILHHLSSNNDMEDDTIWLQIFLPTGNTKGYKVVPTTFIEQGILCKKKTQA